MSKYIELPIIIEWDDKDEADRTADGGDAFGAGVLFAVDYIEKNIPEANVAKVVRCRDCRYWSRAYLTMSGNMSGKCLCTSFIDEYTPPDAFCSWAKQRDR